MNSKQISGVLRHLMTILGGYGFAVSQDELLQLLSAMATLLGIVWSIWDKRMVASPCPPSPIANGQRSDGQARSSSVMWLAALPLLAVGWLLSGCGSTKIEQVVTPSRVKAVVTWGAYAAARAQLPAGREALERAKTGLETLQASDKYDVAAVAAALQAGGITWLSTTEGTLAVGAAISFEDLFHDAVQPIASSTYAKAVVDGALAGLQMALATERSLPHPVGTDAQWIELKAQAEATR